MNLTTSAFSFLAFVLLANSAFAENQTKESPITMEQLMRELRIQGGNFEFSFDEPVYARVTTEVTERVNPFKKDTHHFDTASPNKSIALFFSASALFVGDYQKPNVDFRMKMLVKLSDCKETEGTRVISYDEQLTGNYASYSPAVPPVPVLGKPYVLHWYFQEGNPYYAKATIEFSAKPFK